MASNPGNGQPRQGYINWDEYFMGFAILSGHRSKDPATQVGAVIVNAQKRIVGSGYNGMPNGISDSELPWGKESDDPLENKHFYVCHAEMNAIVNKYSADVNNCSIYVSLFPCNDCAKIIIQSGIKEVIYSSDKNKGQRQVEASKEMFRKAGVKIRKFETERKRIVIEFPSSN